MNYSNVTCFDKIETLRNELIQRGVAWLSQALFTPKLLRLSI